MHCPVSVADTSASSLPKSLERNNSPTLHIHATNVDERTTGKLSSTCDKKHNKLPLVGDLAFAHVSKIKRFSIHAPEGKHNTDCNIIISGLLYFFYTYIINLRCSK